MTKGDIRWIENWKPKGVKMKPTDNYTTPPKRKKFDKTKWDMIIGKLMKLGTAIEMYWGPGMDIDDPDYRWVDDRIKYYRNHGRLLTKDEMRVANNLWTKYKA